MERNLFSLQEELDMNYAIVWKIGSKVGELALQVAGVAVLSFVRGAAYTFGRNAASQAISKSQDNSDGSNTKSGEEKQESDET